MSPVKVFISWSGERSKDAADKIYNVLDKIDEDIIPWMSSQDTPSGESWYNEIQARLSESDVGIVCVTPENSLRPWINYETGFLKAVVKDNNLHTVLIGPRPDTSKTPLDELHVPNLNKEVFEKMIMGCLPVEKREGYRAKVNAYWDMIGADLKKISEDDYSETVGTYNFELYKVEDFFQADSFGREYEDLTKQLRSVIHKPEQEPLPPVYEHIIAVVTLKNLKCLDGITTDEYNFRLEIDGIQYWSGGTFIFERPNKRETVILAPGAEYTFTVAFRNPEMEYFNRNNLGAETPLTKKLHTASLAWCGDPPGVVRDPTLPVPDMEVGPNQVKL